MSVYKPAKSPYFQFDFVRDGRRFHGSTGCRTKREALRQEEREREKARNAGKGRPPITLDEACGLYEDKVSELPSWRNAERTIKVLVAHFGSDRLVANVEQRELLALVAFRRKGRTNASVNREIEVWRALWRWAGKNRFDVGEMPDWGALMLKVPNAVPRELSATEETNLFGEIRADLFDFCLFALKTGWRWSEVANLRWIDVDLNAAMATTVIKGGDTIKRPLTQEMVVIIANQPRAAELPAAGHRPRFHLRRPAHPHGFYRQARPVSEAAQDGAALSTHRVGPAQAMGGCESGCRRRGLPLPRLTAHAGHADPARHRKPCRRQGRARPQEHQDDVALCACRR